MSSNSLVLETIFETPSIFSIFFKRGPVIYLNNFVFPQNKDDLWQASKHWEDGKHVKSQQTDWRQKVTRNTTNIACSGKVYVKNFCKLAILVILRYDSYVKQLLWLVMINFGFIVKKIASKKALSNNQKFAMYQRKTNPM